MSVSVVLSICLHMLTCVRSAKPGVHFQAGKLVGASKHEVVLGLESGIRVHFPRNGYIVREAGSTKL